MPYLQKKPVIVEAVMLHEYTPIETLEGTMLGRKGDFLITGVEGEKYPCKPEIFHKTYYEVTEDVYKEYRRKNWVKGMQTKAEDFV